MVLFYISIRVWGIVVMRVTVGMMMVMSVVMVVAVMMIVVMTVSRTQANCGLSELAHLAIHLNLPQLSLNFSFS